MKRGHYVNFRDLTVSTDLKELNDILNEILRRLDESVTCRGGACICCEQVSCAAGESRAISFQQGFAGEPCIFAYSEDGADVVASYTDGTVTVGFADPASSGMINIIAIGKRQ